MTAARVRRALLSPALAGLLLAACFAAPAGAATKAAQPPLVRSFRPVSVKGSTMIFRVRAVSPASVQRAQLVIGAHRWTVKASVVREALRRKRLIRTRLTTAVAARKTRRAPIERRNAFLAIYLRRTGSQAPKVATTPAKGTTTTGTQPATSTTGTKKAASAPPLVTFPCGGTWGQFSGANLPGACWRPYSDDSPFNRQLPANPRLAADSAGMIATMTGWGQPESPYAGGADTTSDWNHPYYFSQPSDPVFTVHCTRSWGTCAVEGLQVHIPDVARPAGAEDGHMAVVDQVNGWEYDFWEVASKPQGGGTLTIAWGGRTRIGTDDSDGLGTDATAAHFGLLAGIIRYPEIAAGQIDHALFMAIRCARGKVYPAEGTGSECPAGTVAPAIGSHIVLAMSDAEIGATSFAPWKKAVLRALAHYGAFVGDTGGSPWGIAIESGSTYTSYGMADPWVPFAQQQPGVEEWHGKYYLPFGEGVDWASRLHVVDPCVDQRTC